MFESVNGRTHGRALARPVYYKLTNEPGELKIKISNDQALLQTYIIVVYMSNRRMPRFISRMSDSVEPAQIFLP